MRRIALVCLVMFACATTPPAPEPRLPRSSIAAVLEHREELQLTGEQVSRLEDIESRQMTKLDDLHARMAVRTNANAPAPSMGMGGRRGMHGGGPHGGGGAQRVKPPPEVLEKVDDLDTQAFMEAIAVFTEEQKPQAIQIASNYRSQMYERRKRH